MKKSSTSANPILDALPKDLQKAVIYLVEVDVYLLSLDPRTLNGNPKNWRVHTQRQRSTYNAFRDKYGFLAFPVYNLCTKRLLDGHMRVEEAIKRKETTIPVILKYLDEEAENEVLATFDNIGLLAKRDDKALKALTEATQKNLTKVKTQADQKLSQLSKDLHELSEAESPSVLLPQAKTKVRPPKKIEPDPIEEEESDESYEPSEQAPIVGEYINGDVFFEGTTWLGIPLLRDDKLVPASDAPTSTYARDGYGTDKYFCVSSGPFEEGGDIGTLGFYTEDERFEDAYSNPEVFADFLAELDPLAVLSPDFSTYSDWPTVLSVYSIYRSRWCARFWQELGHQIIPSLQNLPTQADTIKYVFETLPSQCPVLALQCRKSDIDGLIEYIKLLVEIRRPEVLVLYGGEEKQKYLHGHLPYTTGKKKIDYRYLMQYTEKRRRNRVKNSK